MGDRSTIEWTEATWNPTTGCDRTSPGCDHCYALTLAKRLKAMGVEKYQNDGDSRTSGPGFGLTLHPESLGIPSSWTSPRTVFVNSMSDLFHDEVPTEFIREVLCRRGVDSSALVPGPDEAFASTPEAGGRSRMAIERVDGRQCREPALQVSDRSSQGGARRSPVSLD